MEQLTCLHGMCIHVLCDIRPAGAMTLWLRAFQDRSNGQEGCCFQHVQVHICRTSYHSTSSCLRFTLRRDAVFSMSRFVSGLHTTMVNCPCLSIYIISTGRPTPSELSLVKLEYHHPQVCHANPMERSRFIRCIYNLLNSYSLAVRYKAAGTLITLSSTPTAIKVHTLSNPNT